MMIIFEGPDGVGKSTLKKAFSKATNERYTCIDRMFPSDIIYAGKYGRGLEFINKKRKELEDFDPFCRKTIYIFIDASFEDIEESLNSKEEAFNTDEVLIDKMSFINFYRFGMPRGSNKIYFYRTGKTISQCVKELIKEVEKYEK